MTDSFGARLRRERERRNIDVADVAARTKVKACLFEALERDDVSQWPAGLFRRSFIRGYAEAIGLDPKATLHEFLEQFPEPGDSPSDRPPPPTAAAAAVATIVAAPGPGDAGSHMRLTLAEADIPFQGGRLIADFQGRWLAAACDMAVVFLAALVVFLLVDRFWMPLGIGALSYYAGGILLLGNSPGVWLFAPENTEARTPGSEPARAPRPRHADAVRARQAESARSAFRAPRRARNART